MQNIILISAAHKKNKIFLLSKFIKKWKEKKNDATDQLIIDHFLMITIIILSNYVRVFFVASPKHVFGKKYLPCSKAEDRASSPQQRLQFLPDIPSSTYKPAAELASFYTRSHSFSSTSHVSSSSYGTQTVGYTDKSSMSLVHRGGARTPWDWQGELLASREGSHALVIYGFNDKFIVFNILCFLVMFTGIFRYKPICTHACNFHSTQYIFTNIYMRS